MLVPVAAAMVLEHVLGRNLFGVFGGVPEGVYVRDGSIRSQGPFQHPILAGTVGAVCFPLMWGIWRRYPLSAVLGMAACITMTLASSSSGPLMSLVFGLAAVAMWRLRAWMPLVRWGAVATYVGLTFVMTRPPYYLISKIDLTGSSTGWHRSRLIESTIEHFSEWWMVGTDRTVHWMGLSNWSEQHADITNYYIGFGVVGGFLAMLLVIAIIVNAFRWVGVVVTRNESASRSDAFMVWCFGAGLFAHAVTGLSVSYFDQSMIFIWLNIAVISSMYSITRPAGSLSTVLQIDASPKVAKINEAWLRRTTVVRSGHPR